MCFLGMLSLNFSFKIAHHIHTDIDVLGNRKVYVHSEHINLSSG